LQIYDLAVIGAGVAGCAIANYAYKEGKKVIIIDRASSPATGASGAAGAFISPKLGQKTSLLEFTNLAYRYAVDFYAKNYNQFFEQSGIVRVPKDKKDEEKLESYKSTIGYGDILEPKELKNFGIKAKLRALYFKDAGVCDAQGLCRALIEDIEFSQMDANTIDGQDSLLAINSKIVAKNIVFATGYQGFKDYLIYMGLKKVWGSRGDFYTNSNIEVSIHQSLSVSAKLNGVIKIGASHVKAENPCMICNGKPLDDLIKEARRLVKIDNLELKETFCGMRSGSKDYIPLVGKVIDTNHMLREYPKIKKGYNRAPIKYKKSMYVFNGLGGRGFVFAPLLAKWLYGYIFEQKEINPIINPDRLFLKWARKLWEKIYTSFAGL